MKIIFFANGNTAVFENKKQRCELQNSWILLFADFLKSNGIDPTKQNYIMPDGNLCKIFKVNEDDYNWRF